MISIICTKSWILPRIPPVVAALPSDKSDELDAIPTKVGILLIEIWGCPVFIHPDFSSMCLHVAVDQHIKDREEY